RGVVSDVEIDEPVAVEIRAHPAQARAIRGRNSRRTARVLELAGAEIPEQARWNGVVSHGGAVVRLAGGRVTLLVAPQGEVHVIANEQVEQAVAVVIQPGGAGRPALVVHASLARDGGESSVALVVIENGRA